MFFKKFSPLSFTIALLLMTSCQNEDIVLYRNQNNTIAPNLLSVMATRSDVSDGELLATYTVSDDPEHPVYLHVFEKDIPDQPFDAPVTRESEVTTDNLTSFYMKAYAEDEWFDPSIPDGQHGSETDKYDAGMYFNKLTVSKDGGKWNLQPTQYWVKDVPLTFWSWNTKEPVVDFPSGSDKASINNFSISSPLPATDIVFAYNRETRTVAINGSITGAESSNTEYSRTDNEVDIRFYHALSEIKFDVSGLTDAVLKKVTMQNMLSKANCAITVSSGVPQFEWTPSSISNPVLVDFSQDFTASDFKEDGTMVDGSGKLFFMIPQTLSDDAAIEISLENASDATDVLNLSKTIAKRQATDTENVKWEPGKFYTYKFTSDPYAYSWGYEFAFTDPNPVNPTSKTETYAVKNADLTKSIDITSLKVRQDNPSVSGFYGYHIKSYQVAGQSVQNVDDVSFSEPLAGMTNVRIDGDKLSLSILKRTVESKGSNLFWNDPIDTAVHPEWHPAGWESQTSGNPIDLSRMDYRKDNISESRDAFSMSTANCYVIRHAGYYKLPLVYGNAMLNGNPNTEAYAPFPTDTDDTDLILGVFKNHLDENITSPFIENNAGCDAATCDVVWQANGPVIQNPHITGTQKDTDDYSASDVRYLEFYVDPAEICQNNSLIAIKDAEGNIIWSWQIWTTNDPTLRNAPIEVSNYNNNKYYFMTIPSVGRVLYQEYAMRPDISITLEQDAPSTAEPLTVTIKQPAIVYENEAIVYQFGRKDPIRSSSTSASSFNLVLAPASLGTIIQHPSDYYHYDMVSIQYAMPNNPMFINLWSGKQAAFTGSAIEQNPDIIKTVYDPSPLGYKVPASGAFTGFTTTGESCYSKDRDCWNVESTDVNGLRGLNFYTSLGPGHTVNYGGQTIWFPLDGMRAGFNGRFLNYECFYYTCHFERFSTSNVRVYMLDVSDQSSGLNTASPCNGHNIRPVTDPKFTAWWTSTGAPTGF